MAAGATYEPIATTTLGSATATVTFSSISGSYTDLVVIFNGAITSGLDGIGVRANNDTGTNYSRTVLSGDGSSASSFNESSVTSMQIGLMGTENSNSIFHVQNYSNTTTNKTFLSRANAPSNRTRACVGLWRSTAAIDRLDFIAPSSTFISGSTFTLYGILAA
jgi:hypothetical protein